MAIPFEAQFFVLRSPLHAAAPLAAPGEETPNAVAADSLVWDGPLLREALWLASPEFARLEGRAEGTGEKGPARSAVTEHTRAARTRYRYLSRRTYRATPFGLFAGVTLGDIEKETCLRLQGQESYARTTRLDFEVLHAVVAAVVKSPEARRALTFRANSSLWETSEGYLYAESRFDGKRRSTHQVRLEKTPYLRHILEAAREGVTGEALARGLREAFPGVSPEEAVGYVAQLIESQVLVPDCEPLVTGEEAAQRLVERRPRLAS